jgi:Sulfotransferase family
VADFGDTVARLALPVLAARARRLTTREAARTALWPAAPAYRKVFVVGCQRSGTTWIRRLVAEHPAVVTGPESHAYPQILGPFTELGLAGRAGWRRVLDRWWRGRRRDLEAGLHMWASFPTLCRWVTAAMATPGVSDQDRAERVIEALFDAYFVAHGGSADRLLLEKTPQHVQWIDRILGRWPDARVIEVLRDGRDVCVSLEMRSATQRWAPRERRRQIEAWVGAVSAGLAFRERPALAGRIHLLRFEDVKAAPLEEAARLLDFVGLPATQAEIARMLDAVSIDRHARKGAGRHVRRGAVGDWRQHFSPEDTALFETLAGDLARRVGYDV